jgi:hypothetical protein
MGALRIGVGETGRIPALTSVQPFAWITDAGRNQRIVARSSSGSLAAISVAHSSIIATKAVPS